MPVMPAINVPHPVSTAPVQATTVTAALNANKQTTKDLRSAIDSAQKDQKSADRKPHADHKPLQAVERREQGGAHTVHRRDQEAGQEAQRHTQTQQQTARSFAPQASTNISYADKLAALASGRKSSKTNNEKPPHDSSLTNITPHVAQHKDGSVSAGLATARLLTDLDGLVGEDVYHNDLAALTSFEGSLNYHGIAHMPYEESLPRTAPIDVKT